jgi:hypothetical protein
MGARSSAQHFGLDYLSPYRYPREASYGDLEAPVPAMGEQPHAFSPVLVGAFRTAVGMEVPLRPVGRDSLHHSYTLNYLIDG